MRLQTSLAAAVVVASLVNGSIIPDLSKDLQSQSETLKNGVESGIREFHLAFKGDLKDILSEKIDLIKDVTAQIVDYYKQNNAQLELAELHESFETATKDDKYIIVFKKGIAKNEVDLHLSMVNALLMQNSGDLSQQSLGGIDFLESLSISDLFNGYVANISNKKIIDFIRLNPIVDYIEKDSVVHSMGSPETQNNAPWGLARISHRDSLNLGNFNKYLYADSKAGEGVTAYVIDTGISVTHNQFQKRAVWGKTIPINDYDIDGNGHGTHCAGTIGSKDFGVAKNANLVAVKVLRSDGSGTMSDVLKGVEWAALQHKKKVAEKDPSYKGATANMSLGGGRSPALDQAVNAAVGAGLHFAVAAGNENQDACNSSPASAEKAITVGASTLSDDRAYFSNYGKCVDIFAPGLNILSTYIGTSDATATLSGTSMATPHVVGLLTYLLSLQPDKNSEFYYADGELTPDLLKKKIIDYSTKNVFEDLPADTPNKLIYNGGYNVTDFWLKTSSGNHASTNSHFSLEDFMGSFQDTTNHWLNGAQEMFNKMNIL